MVHHNLGKYGQALMSFLCLTACGSSYKASDEACNNLDLFASRTAYSRDLSDCLTEDNPLFSEDTLKTANKKLLDEKCRPVSLSLVGRHAARQPSEEEILQMDQNMEEFKSVIRSSGPTLQTFKDQLINSKSKFSIKHNNLITSSGANRHRSLALRLKAIYPEFFNAHLTNVTLGTTSKMRTVQTGVEFVKAIDGYQLKLAQDAPESCKSRKSPGSYDLQRVLEDECFASVLSGNFMAELEFHKICKKQIKQELREGKISKPPKPAKSSLATKISEIKSELLAKIVERLSRQLRLNEPLSTKMVGGLYDVCRYETSVISDSRSTWCNLFERDDLEKLEYLEDASIYHKMAAGRDSYRIQSAPLLKDILNRLKAASQDASGQLQSFLGFTHDGVLKKLLVALGFFDLNNQIGYTLADLDRLQHAGELPEERRWRSSLMVPFSANVVFALYRCDGNQFKVLTSIAERPVRIQGCAHTACLLEDLLGAYRQTLDTDNKQVCLEVRKMMNL